MQLSPDEEVIQVSGATPIRAHKVRYYLDPRLSGRVGAPPSAATRLAGPPDDWSSIVSPGANAASAAPGSADEGGHRIEPELEGMDREAALRNLKRILRSMGRATRSSRPPTYSVVSRRSPGRPPWILTTASLCEDQPMKVQAKVFLPGDVARALDDAARRMRRSKSEIMVAALASYLSPDGAEATEAAVTRRLDRMSRQIERLERDLTISNEAVALFVRTWLRNAPSMSSADDQAAIDVGRERYLDQDHLLIEHTLGNAPRLPSGWPGAVYLWTRGTPLSAAREVFRAEPAHALMMVSATGAGADRVGVIMDAADFSTISHHLVTPDGQVETTPLPQGLKIGQVVGAGQRIVVQLAEPATVGGKSYPADSILAYETGKSVPADKRLNPVFAPTDGEVVSGPLTSIAVGRSTIRISLVRRGIYSIATAAKTAGGWDLQRGQPSAIGSSASFQSAGRCRTRRTRCERPLQRAHPKPRSSDQGSV
jgi:predicted transcriptional regulator